MQGECLELCPPPCSLLSCEQPTDSCQLLLERTKKWREWTAFLSFALPVCSTSLFFLAPPLLPYASCIPAPLTTLLPLLILCFLPGTVRSDSPILWRNSLFGWHVSHQGHTSISISSHTCPTLLASLSTQPRQALSALQYQVPLESPLNLFH